MVEIRDGMYVCDLCHKAYVSMVALGGHRRNCDGGNWKCTWCVCSVDEAKGKAPGPEGPKTLCAACGSRFRSGHLGPPQKDADGMYVCPSCKNRFTTIPALGGHRRYCDPEGKNDVYYQDDLDILATLVSTRGRGMKPESEAMLLPPEVSSFDNAQQTLAVVAICGLLERFGEELNLKPIKPDQLTSLLTQRPGKDVPKDKRNQLLKKLHVDLLRLLMEDTTEPEEAFFDVDMKDTKGMLDDVTWTEILRKHVNAVCPNLNIQDAVRRAVKELVLTDYESLGVDDKVAILSFLSSEVLDTERCRVAIDEAIDTASDIGKERMDAGVAKKKRAHERELKEWLGRTVELEDGKTGVIESGSRGVYRVKLDGGKLIVNKRATDMKLAENRPALGSAAISTAELVEGVDVPPAVTVATVEDLEELKARQEDEDAADLVREFA
jgi:hypothetical protein